VIAEKLVVPAFKAAIAFASKEIEVEPWVTVTVPALIGGGEIQEDSKRLKDQRFDSLTCFHARFIKVRENA
jgi:hypothetical protein